MYEKEKRNRKWQDSWKWAASGEEHWWLAKDESKNKIFCSVSYNHGICGHQTLLDAQPLSVLCNNFVSAYPSR